MFERPASRRQFLSGIAGGAAALSLRPFVEAASLTPSAPPEPATPAVKWSGALPTKHLAWVWQFNHDGEPERIRETLAQHGLGIAMKTHDGTTWMSKWDTSRNALSGPQQIEKIASFFEAGGVPFHAWCVVKGTDAALEASMAASVLASGARSLSIDLESYPGFWSGTQYDALQYTGLLRNAPPDATIMTTIDARPWEYDRIPIKEFAAASNALAPQVYWSDFGTPANINRYRSMGADPGAAGVTAAFTLDIAVRKLTALGLPIHPIGPGLGAEQSAWAQFMTESYARDVEAVSVWRFGTTTPRVWEMLEANPPRPRSYVVQPGDSLGRLAGLWNTSIDEIVRLNGLADPNLVVQGQRLAIPRGKIAPVVTPQGASTPVSAPVVVAPVAAPPPPTTYVVQPGDSAWALARRWNTTPQRIAEVNGLSDMNIIVVGQRLRIP